MKSLLNFLLITGVAMGIISCEHWFDSGIDNWYFLYIDGDEGRVVEISYLQENHPSNYQGDSSSGNEPKEPFGTKHSDKDIIVSQTVTLPFFKEVHTVGTNPDSFLEIISENDSTTRAMIFNNSLSVRRTDGRKCWSVVGNLTGRSEYGSEDCEECTSCHGLTRDSIFNYMKEINYPCYMEFSKDDMYKRINLNDYRNRYQ